MEAAEKSSVNCAEVVWRCREVVLRLCEVGLEVVKNWCSKCYGEVVCSFWRCGMQVCKGGLEAVTSWSRCVVVFWKL